MKSYKDISWIPKGNNEKEWEPRFVGFLPRLLAISIDAVIIFILTSMIQLIPENITGTIRNNFFLLLDVLRPYLPLGINKDQILFITYYELIAVFYFSALTSSHMQGTLGKWLIGIFVTNYSGYRIGGFHAAIRMFTYIFSILPLGAGLFLMTFGKEKRAVHDKMCSTIVMWGKPNAKVPEMLREARTVKKYSTSRASSGISHPGYDKKSEW